jgi:solute carrier family 35 protein F5
MILNTTSGFFTLFVGALCKIEKISLLKIFAVSISFVGVICITLHDLNAPSKKALIGDGLALLSAALYGCYTVYLKQHLKSDSHDLVIVFFGYVGFATMLIMMPLIPVLHFSKFETFELPTNHNVYPMLIGNALIGTVLSQYLWARAMLLTTPLISTLGLSLTIPLTIIGEVILGTARFSWNFILGAVAIVFGFALANAGYTWQTLEGDVDAWMVNIYKKRFQRNSLKKQDPSQSSIA